MTAPLRDPALSDETKLQVIREGAEAHRRAQAGRLTKLLQYWIRVANPRPRTVLEARRTFKLLAQGATSPTISGVVKADVVALRDSLLAKGKSTSTVTKAISLIKAAYGAAIADDQFSLKVNPAAGVVVRGRASKRRPVWTMEQLNEALKALWPAHAQPAVSASPTRGVQRRRRG